MSLWGNLAAVGAVYKNIGANKWAGTVYMYKRTGSSWQYFQTIIPDAGSAPDSALFGVGIKLCDNYMIIGAQNNKNQSGVRTGAAYIYHYNGNTWVETNVMFGNPGTNPSYGTTVSINQLGTYCCVSDITATVNGMDRAGVVQVYNFSNGVWNLQATLQDPGSLAFENFGTSVAMSPSGDYIIVGAPNKSVTDASRLGYVGLFRRAGSSWSQYQTYFPQHENNLNVGRFVDVTDNNAVFTTYRQMLSANIPSSGQWSPVDHFYRDTTGVLRGVAIDAQNENLYMWRDNGLYFYTDQTQDLNIKSFTYNTFHFDFFPPCLLAVQNGEYIMGFPNEPDNGVILRGAFYIGSYP